MTENRNDQRDNRAEYQQDTVLDHEYDGIQEFDNRLPNWWMWIMWGSMAFGLAYWIIFHTLGVGVLPHERFERTMQAAQEAQLERALAAGIDNEFFVMMSRTEANVAAGREVFVKHCVQCHLDDGRGSVGPNLTDEYWIAHQHLGMAWGELLELSLLGFQAAFLPYEAKVNLLEEMESQLLELDEA